MSECIGNVYLVGAGPGTVAYLTLRGQQLLSQAEVVIYDALIDPQLLELVPPSCLKLDVGKRGGCPSTPQAEIDRLLVKYCLQGKQVVRLKNGDPFIFGRAKSEIQALIAANCPFEVVPGISSALAAPLLSGIPLTDVVLSRCFVVLTAHDLAELDWEALSRIDTIVILMGGRHLGEIVERLQRYGRSPQTPIAAIRACGCPEQQIWSGTLANIVEQTSGVSLSPVVIVIGEVVRLRDELQVDRLQVERSNLQPSPPILSGKTVLVTRSAEQSSQFSDLLHQQGAQVIEMPALVICPPSSWDGLDHAIAHLSDFDWLILTSTNGVDYFFERLLDRGKDARNLAGVKIAAVGKKTAVSLKARHLKPDFIPPNFVADSLIEHFPEPLTDKKILFPRVETGGRDVLVKELTARGANIVEVPAYQSACPSQISPDALAA
ncbi:MAG: uroporphyrinogen-III C-methyltransferase, partial [Coleofasciculus sp. S288]|nr:uroporphyrinogen-III C-methyltransferase [Coleofasciculus sp. S288]